METQRDDGAWDWLDVGLEPFESIDSAYLGAAFAALAVGLAPPPATAPEARGVARLQAYLRENHAGQNLHNRIWGLLASTRLPQLLPRSEIDALVGELQRRQGKDGGWSLNGLDGWRWKIRRTLSVAGPTGSGARRAIRRLRDRPDRLHAEASRCAGRARHDCERPAVAERPTSCLFASVIRNGSPGAPTLSTTTASTAVREGALAAAVHV